MFDGDVDGDRRRHLLLAIDSAFQFFWRLVEGIPVRKAVLINFVPSSG